MARTRSAASGARRALVAGLGILGFLAIVAAAAWAGHWANPQPELLLADQPVLTQNELALRGLLNALPCLLFFLLLLALTRRVVLSLLLAALPMLALHAANALKLKSLEVPLIPADFALLPQLLRGSGVLWHYGHELGVGPLVGLGAVVLLGLLAWLEPRLPLRPLPRLVQGAGAALALASLVAGTAPWPALYEPDWLVFWPWEPRRSVETIGLESSLLRYHWQLGLTTSTADPQRVRAFLHGNGALPAVDEDGAVAEARAEAPDIVVVQSESLFDPGRLKGVDSSELLPTLHRLSATARAGDLWVPAFGGGTVRTEFEVLTGIALRYAPTLDYPYLQLSDPSRRSLPQVLRSRGYRTVAIHANDGSFWNRAATFRSMGFQRFVDGTQFGDAKRCGYYVRDEEMNPRVLAALDDGPGPHFVFVVTIENHGPYDASQPGIDPAELATVTVPPGLAPDDATALRLYLLHLRHADAALGALADALKARPRRSLLLFYGDHLPGLNGVYDTLGFRDGQPANLQPVPYVLVDSAGGRPHRVDLGANFVPGWLLARAGIRDEPYFAVADLVRRATHFGPAYTPAFDGEFGEMNRLRLQRGFCRLFAKNDPAPGYACPANATADAGTAAAP